MRRCLLCREEMEQALREVADRDPEEDAEEDADRIRESVPEQVQVPDWVSAVIAFAPPAERRHPISRVCRAIRCSARNAVQ